MSAKPVVVAFGAGVILTVAVLVGVGRWNLSPSPSPTSEALALADGVDAATAVAETETIVEHDSGPVVEPPAPTAQPAPAKAVPVTAAPPRRTSPVEPRVAASVAAAPDVELARPRAEQQEPNTSETGHAADVAFEEPTSVPPDRPVSVDGRSESENSDAPALDPYPTVWDSPAPVFEELVIAEDSVISLEIETSISTDVANVEDRVVARTIRDVKSGQETAIPAGSTAIGSVTLVEIGGKVRERARLGVRFHTIELSDGSDVAIETETIFREGRSPAKGSAARIGGAATAGAILGAIFGGRRGAVIGGAAGAAGGTAATMATDREPATLPAGTNVTIRLTDATTVTIER